jgi:multiple sugar transport system permease protein
MTAVRKRRGLVGWVFVGPALALLGLLFAFPAGWSVLLSFQNWNGFGPMEPAGLSNYADVVASPDALAAVGHTLGFAALFVPASVVGGLALAIALNRRIALVGVYRTAIFIPFVTSAAATGILANYVFDPNVGALAQGLRMLGLPRQGFLEDPAQALWIICLVALWGGMAFTVVIYMAALQGVGPELKEAAKLDGATRLQTYLQVILPQLLPVTVFVAIWQSITAIQLFDIVYTTTRGGPLSATETVVYFIYQRAFERADYGGGSAAAIILFLVTLAATVLALRASRDSTGGEVAR